MRAEFVGGERVDAVRYPIIDLFGRIEGNVGDLSAVLAGVVGDEPGLAVVTL